MQTIDRIIQLLELLSKHKNGLGINEISEKVGLPLSTTHRMLNGLKDNEYIAQDDLSKRYKLGVGILTLAVNMLNNLDIINISKPIIEKLSTRYEQLVFLSVLKNDNVICVDMVNNAERAKFYVQIGINMPVHCSAAGKIIAAYQNESVIDKILKAERRKEYTIYTKMDTDEIKNELSIAKELGYAICDEEMEIGVKAIAAPIKDKSGRVCASITIMLLKQQLKYDLDKVIKDLKISATEISKYLGYTG